MKNYYEILGVSQLSEALAFPSGVRGPVDSPPCKRHRPESYRSFRLQGVPARVRAPHLRSRSTSGNVVRTSEVAHFRHNLRFISSSMTRPFGTLGTSDVTCPPRPDRERSDVTAGIHRPISQIRTSPAFTRSSPAPRQVQSFTPKRDHTVRSPSIFRLRAPRSRSHMPPQPSREGRTPNRSWTLHPSRRARLAKFS